MTRRDFLANLLAIGLLAGLSSIRLLQEGGDHFTQVPTAQENTGIELVSLTTGGGYNLTTSSNAGFTANSYGRLYVNQKTGDLMYQSDQGRITRLARA